MKSPQGKFAVLTVHKFFDVNATIVEREIRTGLTVSLTTEVDLSIIESIRAQIKPKPSYTTFVVKAVAIALKEFPYANRRILRKSWIPFRGNRIQQFTTCDFAIACEKNLPDIEVSTFIDILRDADKHSLAEINDWLHALANSDESSNKQWREYKTLIFKTPGWLAKFIINLPVYFPTLWSKWRGGAVIISSPAKYGVDIMTGSWMNPLGITFGFVKKRAFVKNDELVICPTFFFSLNFDRRVMAGAQAARFFKRIVDVLEHADKELKDYF
jgi:pyruvate/2-oxoglutarate dehydrogenase complex dihydrolipoamide acyltransferase (E2) component